MNNTDFREIQKHFIELNNNQVYKKMLELSELACDIVDTVECERDLSRDDALEIVKIAVMMEHSEKQKQLIDQMELLRHQLLERGLS